MPQKYLDIEDQWFCSNNKKLEHVYFETVQYLILVGILPIFLIN